MKNGRWKVAALLMLALWVAAATGWGGETAAPGGAQLLARVEVTGSLGDIGLPLHADLLDGAGKYYALTIVAQEKLQSAGVSFRVIDGHIPGARYLIARERRPGARSRAAREIRVLYDDGLRIIVKEAPGLADLLSEMGFALKLMGEAPMILVPVMPESRARAPMSFGLTPDPLVSQMIGAVSQDTLLSRISGLSGETPVTVEGASYTIATRYTGSGVPLQKATQYAFEQLQTMGLAASFQNWTYGSYAGSNVVGELRGESMPDEIILITAHLDSMPSAGPAPGADDNASGCAALLTVANIMSRYRFQRTIRFVFFTGEEQGLLGSAKYAESQAGQAIVAIVNMDMIGYSSQSTPLQRLHTRVPGNPGYEADLAIAGTFVDVINGYGIAGSIQPVITSDGESASDHSSFWDNGFAAILVIEDHHNDFNPYYHTGLDKLQYLNPAYFTAHAKASLGTVAHLARPLGQQFGTVVIDADPNSIDAPWTLTGPGAFSRSGQGDITIPDRIAGGYSIAWGEVACYAKPEPATKSLPGGDSVRFAGNYIRIALMGDLNNDGAVLVADAILGLKAMAEGNIEGIRPNDVASCIEVNGDGLIGFAEVIYILQKASGMR